MEGFPQLNFPAFTFRVKRTSGRHLVWDQLRGCWLVLSPEEWVRRHVICWLVDNLRANPRYIMQECPVQLGSLSQRADIVVFDREGRPLLLAECKAPGVAVSEKTLAQAVRYNSVLGARYLLLTNGIKHYMYEMKENGDYAPLEGIPALK